MLGLGLQALGVGGIAQFDPASVFVGGAAGLWLDPSDRSTGFQDSAGTTPQTASGQPTGKRLDKSGRGNHVLQSTSLARPEYDLISGIASDFFDGSDDGYATASFVAGTFTAAMDFFCAVKYSSAAAQILVGQTPADAGNFFGARQAANHVSTASGVGAGFTLAVDGTVIADDRDTLATALGTGSWHVLEYRGLDLSTWTGMSIANTVQKVNADNGGLILCPTQSATNRTNLRRWLGAKVGLSL